MRGPFQEARRIPHALRSVPPNPEGYKWRVELLPLQGDPVLCPLARTTVEAYELADPVLKQNFPGGTL